MEPLGPWFALWVWEMHPNKSSLGPQVDPMGVAWPIGSKVTFNGGAFLKEWFYSMVTTY